MIMRSILFSLVILISVFSCNSNSDKAQSIVVADTVSYSSQKITWKWEGDFSAEEQKKMKEWITFVSDCAQKVLGRFPFDLNYHFHRADGIDYAVGFGYTRRTSTYQSAHFDVNPIYPMEDFMNDWIAPHEISHLALPRLDQKDKWFFEGFATYLSRKVMIEMGTITEAEADSTARARIANIKYAYESNSNFVFVADSMILQYGYTELYWGGGSYFHKIDRKLKQENKISLVDVLKYFQMWRHQPDLELNEVIDAFDRISQSTVFSDLCRDYTTLPARGILIEY